MAGGGALLVACSFPNYWLVVSTDSSEAGATGNGGASEGGAEVGPTGAGEGGAPAAEGGAPGLLPIDQGRGCTAQMRTCLRMDESPEQGGWTLSLTGNATAHVIQGIADNQVMSFFTPGSESAPGPAAKFSWSAGQKVPAGRMMFDLRIAELGPYTRVTSAEIDLGPRKLRLELRTMPRREVALQLVAEDGATVLDERAVPEPSFFEQVRLVELDYTLGGSDPTARVLVEAKPVAELHLGTDWQAAAPMLAFGTVSFVYPTSSARFEIDNLGFDDLH